MGLKIAVGHSGRHGHWQLGWMETWWRRPVDVEVRWLVMELIPCLCFRFCFKGTQVETELQVVYWEHSTVGGSDAEQGLTAQYV